VWLEAPAPTLTVVKEFVNESHRTKSSDDIDQDKMASLEARIRAIEERYDGIIGSQNQGH
jgi:hypothetical protein